MTNQHRATPEHPWAANPEDWQRLYENAHQGMEDSSCILELRARVEALEKAQRIRSGPEPPLVERVADAIAGEATSAGIVDDRPARAAIREVAAWLNERDIEAQNDPDCLEAPSADDAICWLRDEIRQ